MEGPRVEDTGLPSYRVARACSRASGWTRAVDPRPLVRSSRHSPTVVTCAGGEEVAMEPKGRGENFRGMPPAGEKKGERLPSGWGKLWKDEHHVFSGREPIPTSWSHVGV